MIPLRAFFLLLSALAGAAMAAEHLAPKDLDFFEKKVRPILFEHCYSCHSTDAKKIKGNLLLDTKAGWEIGGDIGTAIVPGKPDDSPLIQAVRYDDPDLEMPPKGSLPNADIETLIEWVERGAPDPRVGGVVVKRKGVDYAAYRQEFPYTPVATHPVPEPTNLDWARNEVDRFLLERLEAESLTPNPDTDPATLLRRLSYDLTGLPPSREQLTAFVADPSDEHYKRLVDELLAAPQFGERWGRHWLDIARYADSSGGGRSKVFHDAWRYRDWVIRAFNEDKPYDQFVREQIAGDLLDESEDGITGTGFLLMAPTNFENQDKTALELDVADEQIDVIGRAFMGMTIGCARCHDHKFDAISHDDYHAMAGIFMSTKSLRHSNVSDPWKRTARGVNGTTDLLAKWKTFSAGKETFDVRIRKIRQDIAALDIKSVETVGTELDGIVLDDTAAEKVGFWTPSSHIKGYLGVGYLHDNNIEKGDKRVVYTPEIPRAGNYEVRASHTPSSNRGTSVPFEVKHADGTNTLLVNQRRVGPIDRVWTSLGTFRFAAGKAGSVVLHNKNTESVVIADAVQFIPEEPLVAEPKPDAPEAQLAAETAAKKNAVDLANLKAELTKVEAEKTAYEATAPPPIPTVMAVAESDKPEDMQERIRGVANKLGERMPRGFLTVATVSAEPTDIEGSGRKQLAEWLSQPENPFTARVAVNRIWLHVFGEGLVRTPDNFGRMGERPSHPELLDWLALRFVEDGWSVKSQLRLLLNSRAYRMSSDMHTGHYFADAENRLLWRAHTKWLEAEALRDTMLLVAGELELEAGGTLVDRKLSNVQSFKQDRSKRRSVYQPVFRNNLPKIFEVFDFADSNQPIGRRSTSVLSTQALYMMNAPEVMTLAETAAERLADEDLEGMFLKVLGRPPRAAEKAAAERYLSNGPEARARLIQTLFASHDFRFLK